MSASAWAAGRGEQWRAYLTGMESMLEPVDEPLIQALRIESRSRIADLGCGGGGTALEILRRAPEGSLVHGFDISSILVELARTRADAHFARFEVADIATEAPEQPYDRIVSRFGVMFFDDPPAAFANLARWLAPRGRFAFAVWGPTSGNAWFTIVRDVVSRIIEVPAALPHAAGPFRYGAPDALLALLDSAGFTDLEVRDWRGTLPIGGGMPPKDAARFALAAFASFGELLAEAGGDAAARAQRAVTTAFAEHLHDGVVRLGAHVRVISGARDQP